MKVILIIALLFNCLIVAQEQDTTKEKPAQYRRGIELQESYQSYEEKYFGKELNEEKRRLFPIQGTGVWTELSPGVPRVTYIGVHFINPETGWIVGDLGAIIKTTNGGDGWTISETNTTTLLLKIHSYNGQVVIATGYDGLILRSTDEGETFEQIPGGTTNDLWGVQMLNDTLGFVCGLNQTLLKTTDSGLSWQSVTTGLNAHYWALDFLDEQYGMIACGGGKVLRTTDGGNNWTQIQAGDASDLYAINIVDPLHAAAAGYLGKTVYSSDGGISWVQNAALQHNELNSIKFIDADTGYTIGTYQGESWGIRKTTNRGQNWFNPPVGNLSEWELELLPNETGYSVGSNLMINKTTGGYDNWGGLFLNADFVDVYFTDEQTGYAADGRYIGGPVYKTTDGGYNWFGLPNFPREVFTSTLRCVTFTDSVTGFAGSAPCRIVKTTDAGDSWYVVNRTGLTDTIGLINRIFFVNPATGWAVTTRGGILKTTDAGENWFAQLNAGINIIFQSIYFVDSLYGWTAGARPYKTTDGGENWAQQTYTNIWNSNDVYFPNQDTGWIAKQSSFNTSLFKTSNAGINWLEITEVLGARSIYVFPDPSHWLITGSIFTSYVVYKKYMTYDAGNSWIDISDDVPVGFGGFSAVTNLVGYAVGNLGLVLRYNDTLYVPVELSSFMANVVNNDIILNWTTSSELNNRGFEVERSTDKVEWIVIGFIEGKGTTTETNNYFFTDNLYENNSQKLFYRLKQIDFDGTFEYSIILEIQVGTPSEFFLSQNYPNPFNPETNIDYRIPEETLVSISLFDVTGRKIKEIVNEKKQPGYYTIKLKGGELSSGIYFYRLTSSSGYSAVKKLTILK